MLVAGYGLRVGDPKNGMMEYWKGGILGNKRKAFFLIDTFLFQTQYPIVPSFHYSTASCNLEVTWQVLYYQIVPDILRDNLSH